MFLRLTEGPWGIVTAQNSQSKYQLDLKADAARGFKKKKLSELTLLDQKR